MAENREWEFETNSRGHSFQMCKRKHLNLSELREDPYLDHRYLKKINIPPYPDPLVFYVPDVCHVTDESSLLNIFNDSGFHIRNNPDDNFLWWSLAVTKGDIDEAEENFLEDVFPYGQPLNHAPFLEQFTTSPAFQSGSRYGNFRFTFPLKELLYQYARQYCYNSAPVLRVLDTRIYQQEIVYSVLVHPRHISCYSQYPRLPLGADGNVCGYSQGSMSWSCQAPSKTHGHRLVVDEEYGAYAKKLKGMEYYVWDHVAVAFHMEHNWILHINQERLFQSVSACEVIYPYLLRDEDDVLSEEEAEEKLENLGEQYGLN